MLTDEKRGIYRKFDVRRTDGSSAPGGKHEQCSYFVLDLEHDKHAPAALAGYADSCRDEFPELAKDLDGIVGLDVPVMRAGRGTFGPQSPSEMAALMMDREAPGESGRIAAALVRTAQRNADPEPIAIDPAAMAEIKLPETRLYECEVGGASYSVAAINPFHAAELIRAVLESPPDADDFGRLSIEEYRKERAEKVHINLDNGARISLWRDFSDDRSPRIIGSSEW